MIAARLVACALVIAGALGCSKSSRPWIDRLEVDAFEGGEVISLSKEQLEAQLVSRLEGAKFQLLKPGQKIPDDVKPWRVELAAGLSEPDLEMQSSYVMLALELTHAGDAESFSIDSRQLVKAPGGGSDVEQMQNAIRDALADALTRAVQEAAALIAFSPLGDEKLVEKLGSPQRAEADAAVRLLVRRHHKAALPALLARLASDDLNELRGVIGQLVELGAPESVNPLIEAARHKGPGFEREVVFAVGSIGGDDAEAYLDLMASGHDDELIRSSAEQALQELRLKKSRPPRGEK
jgi:hypothetical protein